MEEKNKKIEELRKLHPTGTLVEFEDETWAFFKKPTRAQMGLAMTNARTNPLGLVDVIVANCLAGCSEELDLKSDAGVGYLFGLAEQIDRIIGTKKAEIKN